MPTQSSDPVGRLLHDLVEGTLSSGELRTRLSLKHRPTFRDNYLRPALEAGYIEMTIPEKPSSREIKTELSNAIQAMKNLKVELAKLGFAAFLLPSLGTV
ncbi:MAG: Fic family protein [Thermodesulfobacteriota bacterium]